MRKRKLFLRLALFFSLNLVAAVIVYKIGWFGLLWRFDATRISFGILALYVCASAYCGKLTWRADELVEKHERVPPLKVSREAKELDRAAERGWIAHDFCEPLGMLGTVLGLISFVIHFDTFEITDVADLKALMMKMAVGIGTALLTTAVGMVCRMLLALQLKHLEQAIERVSS